MSASAIASGKPVALIKGFCYDTAQPLTLTRAQWEVRVALVLAAGGSLRIEGGVTHAHGIEAQLSFEVQAELSEPPRAAAPAVAKAKDEELRLAFNVLCASRQVTAAENQLRLARADFNGAVAAFNTSKALGSEAA